MTRRLLLSYLSLAVLILFILEGPLAVLVSRYEKDLASTQVQRVATGLAIAAGEDFEHDRQADLRTVALRYRDETGGEVEILGPAGQVLADSDTDHDNDATGSDRLFVAAARAGRSVSGVVADEGEPQAVAAVPIGGAGEPGGVVLLGLSASATVQRIHLLWICLAGFALMVLALTLVLGLLMARSLSDPLGRLAETVDELGRNDLTARARTDDGPPELRALARQFNQMASRLAELVDAQARFVADASHQLRSPLTALRLRLENLEIGAAGPGAETVSAAGREVQRLSRLVDGLLTLGQADRSRPERSPVDLAQVIDERCRGWAALAAERHVDLAVDDHGAPQTQAVLVPGDLEQILDNLLANALDASPPATAIGVRLITIGGGAAEIHVVDHGRGMTDDERKRAFDRFWQAPGSRGGHSGLGLAIVRQLALRNGFEVELWAATGGGVEAVIRLPVTPDHLRRVATPA